MLISLFFAQLWVLFQKVDSIFVFSRELHVAILDLALPSHFLVDSLDVALKVAKAVESVGAAVAGVRFDVGVL